jgi:hypothetical protein
MKRWIGFAFLISLVSVLTMGSSCRHLAQPTFPATNTFTPTVSSTPTNTVQGTPTNTFTVTKTPTPGSPTATPTITNTPTITPTNTITNTPGGATATPTTCNPVVQATYTFDTGTQCWALDGNVPGETVGYSTTVYHTNPGSWEGYIPFLSGGSTVTGEEASISFPCGTFENFTSAAVTAWVYSTLGGLNAQMFCNFGTSPTACYAGYENPGYCSTGCTGQTGSYASLTANTWTMVYFNPVLPATDAQYISKFGVNVLGATGPATVYIDDVSITLPAGATATPTNTPTTVETWTFTSSSYDGWVTEGGNVTGTLSSLIEPGYSGSATDYCVNLNAPFTGSNQSAGIQQGFTVPLNLTGGGIACYMWMDAGTVTTGNPGGQIFPTDNTGVVSYSYYHNLTQGSWTYLNLTAANFGSVNAGAITQIAIQAATGGGAVATTGNVKIDDIVAY